MKNRYSITVAMRYLPYIVFCSILLITGFLFNFYASSYHPPKFDVFSVYGSPDTGSISGYSKIHIGQNYQIGLCGEPNFSNGKLNIFLTNPSSNNILVMCQVYKGESIIGSSGLIKPGKYLKSINIDSLDCGEHDITIKVLSYEFESYYSMGSANFKIKIIV